MVGGDFQKSLQSLVAYGYCMFEESSVLTHRTPEMGGLPTPLSPFQNSSLGLA